VTLGGVATFSAQPIFSSLTASSAVATDASKGLVSVTNTGTGNNVLATGPTISGPTISDGTANGVAYLNGSKVLTTGSALVFDGTNLGVGVTPSAWRSTFKALQLTGTATVSSNSNTTVYLGSNWYNNSSGADIYTVTGAAGIYAISAGTHAWYNAPSGTAGNAMSLTQALTLNTNGVLALQGASTSATGVGITFPATQSASTDANTLDDYEEGTCNLTLAFGGASVGITYANQLFVYTKIGRQVTITGELQLLNKGSSTGTAVISGLPFPAISGQGGYASAGVSYTLGFSFTGILGMVTLPNTSTVGFNILSNGTVTALTNSNFTNTSDILFTVTYFTT
jgi:hypothetical protein